MTNKKKFATDKCAQRNRLLKALREAAANGVKTIEAREALDIMMPAARVHELRHDYGYNIQKIVSRDVNVQGNQHRCSRYILFTGSWKGGRAA